ncbi:hypothetical protein L6R52_29485, partial [Myxococcota bacterium]|nr:hypothetical protein [Myxococcota bacterium]
MTLFSKRVDPALAELEAQAELARSRGDVELARQFVAEAVEALVAEARWDEAIELYLSDRDLVSAAELAERIGDFRRAGQLWFRAGDVLRAAQSRMESNEPMIAAELFERAGDFVSAGTIYEQHEDLVRASALFEKAGDRFHAAELLVRALSSNTRRVIGSEADEACRRAAVLYAEMGHVDHAVRVLRWGGQNVFAGKLLARAGRTDEGIELLVRTGDYLTAAEIARAAGNERRAQVLLAERAEKEGHFSEAAAHFEQAEMWVRAARLYEYAGEHDRAAEVYERSGQLDSAAELYEQVGRIEDAKRCLRGAGRAADAAALDDRAGHHEDSIRQFALAGDFVRAAEALVALARRGNRAGYAEAIRYLGAVANDHADYFSARTLLAEIFAEQGDHRSALGVLQALLSGREPLPDHAPALYHYAHLLELEGYLAAARQAYRTILAIDPHFRDVKERLFVLRESDGPSPAHSLGATLPATRTPPVRTVTGVPIQAPQPRGLSGVHAVPVAPMVSAPGLTPVPAQGAV